MNKIVVIVKGGWSRTSLVLVRPSLMLRPLTLIWMALNQPLLTQQKSAFR